MSRDSTEVTVRLFGLLDELPESRVTLALPGEATLADLLDGLARDYGDKVKERLLHKDGRLRDDVKLVVGAEIIDRLDHKIEPAATVFILSQFAGGEAV